MNWVDPTGHFKEEPYITQDDAGDAGEAILISKPESDLCTTESGERVCAPVDQAHFNVTTPYGPPDAGYLNVNPTAEFHYGIDLASYPPYHVNIYAMKAGTVYLATSDCEPGNTSCRPREDYGRFGNAVIINHSDGETSTLYGHLKVPMVKTGDEVMAGQLIGYMGTTGISSGIHLHFETHYDLNGKGLTHDPLQMIPTP